LTNAIAVIYYKNSLSRLLVNKKTHFIVAALTAALLASPFANAASGFSRGSSGSSKSTSSVARSDTRTSYGSYSGFGSSNTKKADTPRVTTFVPTIVPRPAAPAAAPSPAKSGFSTAAKTGTAVAGVATASALGGAMYSASANRDAVDAYQAKQKAAAPQVTQDTSSRGPAVMAQSTASNYQPHTQQQPQVIVVQQGTPQYHDSHSSLLTNAFWYESGRAAARRDERERDYQYAQMQQAQAAQMQAQAAQMQAQAAQAQAAQAQAGYAPSVQPVAPSVAPAAIATAPAPTAAYASAAHTPAELKAVEAQKEHHTSFTLILLFVFLIGAIGLIVWLVLRDNKAKAATKANYTL
jgi:hypothetical protein